MFMHTTITHTGPASLAVWKLSCPHYGKHSYFNLSGQQCCHSLFCVLQVCLYNIVPHFMTFHNGNDLLVVVWLDMGLFTSTS